MEDAWEKGLSILGCVHLGRNGLQQIPGIADEALDQEALSQLCYSTVWHGLLLSIH
jgi:hypothetical protein